MGATWRLPGYVIEELLGTGGSGQVWRGRVARSGEAVALKRVRVAGAHELAAVRGEAALLAALDHPNLLRLHDWVPVADGAVLVLDLAAGGSLADLISARGRLSAGETVTALAPVAAALAYAHGASVVHGDLSAANVLFTEAGLPLLADLGVARLLGDTGPARSTPGYVDPAVAAGAPPSPRSDVFMLGGVVLHALTGEATWPAADAEAALAAARQGDLREVLARLDSAGLPEAMVAVVRRALDPDPHRRGTAADLALDLRHSCTPLAVELAAGRPRRVPRAGPRHARPPGVDAAPNGVGSPDAPGSARWPASSGRPAFERPTALSTSALAQLPLTRHVAPRPRPALPRRPPRRRVARLALPVAVLLAVAAVAGGLLLWAPWRGDGHRGPGRTADAARITSASPVHPPAPDGTATWLAALRSLDATRAAAFARRDPALLRSVYLPGALLREDTALLDRLVPRGCVLLDVRTAYTAARVVPAAGGGVAITTLGRLHPATLTCGGRVRSRAPASADTVLRIELVRTPAGVRIAGQQVG